MLPRSPRCCVDRPRRSQLQYSVEGTFGVEVGRLGSPTFGPMTLFSGDLRAPAFGR